MEPKEIFMDKPGGTTTVKIVATFNDGGTRDVTREANIDSNIPDVAAVGDKADIKGARIGEATLLVRYQGKFTSVPVTVLNPAPGFAWKQLAAKQLHRPADRREAAAPEDSALGLWTMLDSCAAYRWISPASCRTQEIRAFVADATPSKLKRSRLIDKLIASPAYVDHWTLKWGDLLQANRKYLGEKGVYEFDEWIRDSIARNKPYDKMVREMLAVERQLLSRIRRPISSA